MTDALSDCRKAFENWHDSLFDLSAATALRNDYGYPQDAHIQSRWQAWQAAWKVKRGEISVVDDVMALKDALVEARATLIKNGFSDLPFLDDGIQNAINELLQKLEAQPQEIPVIDIDRIARAIRAQAEYAEAYGHTEEQFQKERPYWIDIAKAAIESMREGSSVCRTQREERGESQVTVETAGSTPPPSTQPVRESVTQSELQHEIREAVYKHGLNGISAASDLMVRFNITKIEAGGSDA